jgi:hypothetical protein
MTAAREKISEINEHLVRLLTDDPSVDYAKLEKLTEGMVTEGASDGNGLDVAKALYRYNSFLLAEEPKKRRGRPKKAKVAVEAAPKKRRGRPKGSKNKPKAEAAPPAPATKKRGRPKGSKNKPKDATAAK